MSALTLWNSLTKFVVVLLVLACGLLVFVWYWPAIGANQDLQRKLMSLDNRIEREEQAISGLRRMTNALQSDPWTIERKARERLRVVKPHETVILFQTPPESSPAANTR